MPGRFYSSIKVLNNTPATFFLEVTYGAEIRETQNDMAICLNIFLEKPDNRGWQIQEFGPQGMVAVTLFDSRRVFISSAVRFKYESQDQGDTLFVAITELVPPPETN